MPNPRPALGSFSLAVLVAATTAQQPVWQMQAGLDSGQGVAMACDWQRDRTVLVTAKDTWEWLGARWVHRVRTPGLPTRDVAIAYDDIRQRLVLFGGYENGVTDDTWEFDGVQWQRLAPAVSPAPRVTRLAFDGARAMTIAFSGASHTMLLDDTWLWDGQTWSLAPAAMRPPPRVRHAFAFDTARQEAVLFSGYDGTWLGDTWTWNGSTWALRAPSQAPAPRNGAAMAYDPARARVVLFGGGDALFNELDDTWEWDGTTWLPIATTSRPAARAGAAMAFEPRSGRLLMMGGGRNDTWSWDGSLWRLEQESPAPIGAITTDPLGRQLLMFGGQTSSSTYSNDTLVGDGIRWTRLQPATSPSPRTAPIVADRARGEVVLFGGYANGWLQDTWTWNGSTWAQRAPANTPPWPSGTGTLHYDPWQQRVLLCFVDGWNNGAIGLWQWNGVDWAQQPSLTPPSPRFAPTFVFDEARGQLLMFGGYYSYCSNLPCTPVVNYDETWLWNGSTWSQANPPQRPGARGWAKGTYDPTRQTVVIVGGGWGYASGQSILQWPVNDVWEWDGVTWQLLPPTTQGTPVYEPGLQRLVLLQQGRGAQILTDTPHAATVFGAGCSGSRGVPWSTCGRSALGNDGFALEFGNVPASTACLVGLSLFTGTTALRPGCDLRLGVLVSLLGATANPYGFAELPIPIPADPILRGLDVHAQALAIDGAAATGFALSPALRVTIGD